MKVRYIAAIVGIALSLAAARPASAVNIRRYPSVWLQTPTSIRIAWETDAYTTGKVLYGLTRGLGSEQAHVGPARSLSRRAAPSTNCIARKISPSTSQTS